MKIKEIIQSEIVQGVPFVKTHTDSQGLTWRAESRGEFDLAISIEDSHHGQIAHLVLEVNPDENTMSSQDTWVHRQWRRQGLATRMYNWAQELGNTVTASDRLSDKGKGFWSNRSQTTESIDLKVGNILDLTRNYPQYSRLLGRIEEITPAGRYRLLIVRADTAAKKAPFVTGQTITVARNYIQRAPIVAEVRSYKVSKAEQQGIDDINQEFGDISKYMHKDIYQDLVSRIYYRNDIRAEKRLKTNGFEVIRTGDASTPIILRSVKNPEYTIKYRAQDL